MRPISFIIAEAAVLARDYEDSPLWRIEGVRQGAITIQQQAARFAAAVEDVTRKDAAKRARDGYIILSAALPDTHESPFQDERETGWVTAHEIGRLFGPEDAWLERIDQIFVTP